MSSTMSDVSNGVSAKVLQDVLPVLTLAVQGKTGQKYEPTIERKRPTITPQKNSLVSTTQIHMTLPLPAFIAERFHFRFSAIISSM